jgi:hypothetical protein
VKRLLKILIRGTNNITDALTVYKLWDGKDNITDALTVYKLWDGKNNITDALTVYKLWDGSIVLELVKRPFQHVLRVDFLHSQQVQHHIICQMERTVQWIWQAL